MSDSLSIGRAVTRRSMLQSMLGGSLTAVGGGLLADVSEAAPATRPARMKVALSAYSFNRQLARNWYARRRADGPAEMTLFDFIDFSADSGVDAVELTAYYLPNPMTQADAGEIKSYAFRRGLDISGTAIGNDFCVGDSARLADEIKLAHDWIAYADQLDAPVIRIFAGTAPRDEAKEAVIERCAETIRGLLPEAEKRGVVLALENHGGITAEPEDLVAIVERVGKSPAFGVNFDSGNFKIPDPYAALEMIAPYAVNAQLKVAIQTGPKEAKKPADLARIVEILRSAHYRGYVALEFEEKEDPWKSIPPVLNEIRRLVDAANAKSLA